MHLAWEEICSSGIRSCSSCFDARVKGTSEEISGEGEEISGGRRGGSKKDGGEGCGE